MLLNKGYKLFYLKWNLKTKTHTHINIHIYLQYVIKQIIILFTIFINFVNATCFSHNEITNNNSK